MKTIYLGADHGGFELKEEIKKHLKIQWVNYYKQGSYPKFTTSIKLDKDFVSSQSFGLHVNFIPQLGVFWYFRAVTWLKIHVLSLVNTLMALSRAKSTPCNYIADGLRKHRFESHLVFYESINNGILIVRALHKVWIYSWIFKTDNAYYRACRICNFSISFLLDIYRNNFEH